MAGESCLLEKTSLLLFAPDEVFWPPSVVPSTHLWMVFSVFYFELVLKIQCLGFDGGNLGDED